MQASSALHRLDARRRTCPCGRPCRRWRSCRRSRRTCPTRDRRDQLVGDLGRAHLGLEVVGRDLRRRHQDAVLAGIDRLDAAVEEIGDVRVLLGLGDAQLRQAEAREVFAEAVRDRLRREGDRQARELVAVVRQADEARELRHAGARKAVEGRSASMRARHLPRAVGAEVHEHDDVAVAACASWDGRLADRRRLHELVGLAARVGGGERLDAASAAYSAPPSTISA